ncbi:precorrin-6A synthase (deacetylating) [Streptoalloteichus tenebrarius]|uniref:Precorrin-6A synthase (Deacetylating) n=1 Tax=Streptoalloteichus tenebrarius (strain ATCC 17920 / DSM 40477 / JCM 4838 / CBS 697.72 / NBRC 16177 / NCIMB 11028 / NRRL B-12390 / A12253. 1 / ISP 5477) TaxID=1933 RepID=A0ABT1HLF5_STRSD|nr:precorrin-6A synthase (deacetylating) [Streptoalloteichus tenebrarius]MCP2256341.1 precorrin-6A synthase (deacetylating) [Streptoalloteichus tenebrarius]BFF04681.1 precorrin-6A synthase (deacetylating) [Streptoalloteichus tenebrarius]
MRARVEVIGIGAGDPGHVTVEGVAALNRADVVFFLDKPGEARELSDLRQAILDTHVPDGGYRVVRAEDPPRDRAAARYVDAVADWRSRRADVCERMIAEHLKPGETGAFLVWGDPALYDSIIAVVDDVLARGRVDFDVRVVPGVSSVSALAARHRTTFNQVGGAVQITTGRRLAAGWPEGADDVVVMLDAHNAFLRFADDPGVRISWGAYVGTEDEILISGRLVDVAERIVEARERARRAKGWIMDSYLLRRGAGDPD